MTIAVDASITRGSFTVTIAAELKPGTVVAVLGPNGSGKSTMLRAIAGLQPVSTGTIRIDDVVVDDAGRVFVPAQERAVGLVPQDYALFPHLTVRDNVAFGPRSRGMKRRAAAELADATLVRLGISDLTDRKPGQISGGQAQRVALARALATEPAILLLDEPLAALDVESRDAVRAELDIHLSTFEGCAILVTHDPLDALLLADRVLVIEEGRIVQDGTPADLAHQPATTYVAALMGVTLLRGSARDGLLAVDGGGVLHIADADASGRVQCVVRPESVTLHRHEPEGSARNIWQGTVGSLQPSHDRVRVLIEGEPAVVAVVTPAAVAELGLVTGTRIWMSMKAVDLAVYRSPAH